MVTNIKEELTVSKKVAQDFDVEKFNLRKLSELEYRKQYQIKISNSFAALENIMMHVVRTLKRISKLQIKRV
jgi:hypothetical protein